VKNGATLNVNSYFGLFGNTYLVNNGTVNYQPDYWYLDANAYWINLGFMNVLDSEYIYPGSFFGTSYAIGTMINSGTIQFNGDGAIYFDYGGSNTGGTFYQCRNAMMKYVYGGTYTPSISYFSQVYLDGTIAMIYTTAAAVTSFSSSAFLFEWQTSSYTTATNMLWTGNVGVSQTVPSGSSYPSVTVCYDPTVGEANIYPNVAFSITGFSVGSCLTGYQYGNPSPSGGVCSLLNGTAALLAGMTPSCPTGQQTNTACGVPSCNPNCNSISRSDVGSIQVFFSLMLACILAMLMQ